MTDLTDKLAEALEKIVSISHNPNEDRGLRMMNMRGVAQETLNAYRAQRDGEGRYRMLEDGSDSIQPGDQFQINGGVWQDYGQHPIGAVFDRAVNFPSRRPLTKGEA